ncbi:Gfo/Idh/MocA family oxidoreductase [Devosia sp. YIM 151766]|uniref:Gfo/Idh/MocA family protein n=1 Tax=Devosia sp. YIM 151766 TaxID=3017325 RepID=UPI00255C85AD|nr:Gfo/Idh/MocA family oxidoreductase [Devosia sp. YIM 151766]WIY52079.1 Gfo/Idh/MocA family oxidoreductase [Devosia sp. YIM 151766]
MIRVGIIGAGYFGAAHAIAIADAQGVELVAACRNDADAIAEFARQFSCRAYLDYHDLLADPEIDAVVIASPHHLHEKMAIEAARNGKHLLIEKPLGHNAASCAAINDVIAETGATMAVGHVMHFMRHIMTAQNIIASGRYGRPVAGNARMIKTWMQGNRRDWHLLPETGGGMLMTAGIHMLDALVWLMGSRVNGVSALSASLQHQQAVDDTALISLRFANGAFGQVQSIGYTNGAPTVDIDIICEGATLKLDADRGVMIGQNDKWEHVPDSSEPNAQHHALVRQWESLRAAIKTAAPVAIDGQYAAHLIDIVEAVSLANLNRREYAI